MLQSSVHQNQYQHVSFFLINSRLIYGTDSTAPEHTNIKLLLNCSTLRVSCNHLFAIYIISSSISPLPQKHSVVSFWNVPLFLSGCDLLSFIFVGPRVLEIEVFYQTSFTTYQSHRVSRTKDLRPEFTFSHVRLFIPRPLGASDQGA